MHILLVHQGAELYGSDRTFVQSVRAFCEAGVDVTVFLPEPGPLVGEIEPYCKSILFSQLFVLRKRHILKLGYWVGFFSAFFRALRNLKKYDAVYINTIVILDYIIACRFSKINSVIHVHEIPQGPIRRAFVAVLSFSRARLIYNSKATQKSLAVAGRHSIVIENGVKSPDVFADKRVDGLNILLIGRFNSLKGQDLLLRALRLQSESGLRSICVKMVGGVYKDQTWHKDSVLRLCAELELNAVVEFFDFQEDVSDFYRWANLVIVPSLMIEPFGLVAIEGMSYGCAVIAADHGGLADIVDHGDTGMKFVPHDVKGLASCIDFYLCNPEVLIAHGKRARLKFLNQFTEEKYLSKISDFVLIK